MHSFISYMDLDVMQGILGELHVLACEGGCKLVSKSQQAMTNYPLQEVKAPIHMQMVM